METVVSNNKEKPMDSDDGAILPRNVVGKLALWDEIAAIISGLIGGGRYGLKIRVPHALVMTFLFRGELSFLEKARIVAKLAVEHASNLAAFAGLYKLMLATLKVLSNRTNRSSGGIHPGSFRRMGNSLLSFIVNGPFADRRDIALTASRGPGLPAQSYHAFLAGAVGGYIVWGRYSSINYQLVLYLASRVLVGCIKLASEKGLPPFSWKALAFKNTYPWAAAGIWGTVMMLFEEYPESLHPSLRRSMDEIYRFTGVG